MTEIINVTPHDVNIVDGSGIVRTFARSGVVARISTNDVVVGDINGIPIIESTFGDPTGIPDPAPDTVFIVSRMVAAAFPDRSDFVIPGPLIRNEQGVVIGANGFGRV